MKYIFTLSIILVYLLSSVTVSGQIYFRQQKDSLLQVIHSTQGKEKLEVYKKLCMLPVPPEELDTYLKFSDDFIEEAQKQKNIVFESDARFDKLTKLFNYNRKEEFLKKIDDYLNFFLKNEHWKNYYATCSFLIETYIYDSKDGQAMQEAKRVYDMAKKQNNIFGIETATYSIGLISINYGHLEEAEKYFKETISLSDDNTNLSNPRWQAYENLCRLLLKKNEYREAIEMSEELNKITDNYFKANPAASRNKQYALLMYYRINAEAYRGLNEWDQAEHYCKLTEELAPDDARAMSYIYYIRAQISEQREQYEKSVSEFDKALHFYEQMDLQPPTVLMNKAKVLCLMGRGIEAYPIYEAADEINSTSFQSMLDSQLGELRTQYETDKHIAEKQRNRDYFLFTLGGCLLLAIALGIWIYYSRKVTRKNRTLVGQIQELQAEQEIKTQLLLQKNTFQLPESDAAKLCPESRKDKICLSLRNLLLKDKIYRDKTLSRDSLIERLGINRYDLEEAFAFCFNTQYADYINFLRLNDSIILLKESDLSMEEISEKIGYGTVRTFQMQFRKKYDMTPREYRKLAKS